MLWQDACESGRAPQEMPFWRSRRVASEITRLMDDIIALTITKGDSHGRYEGAETQSGIAAIAG